MPRKLSRQDPVNRTAAVLTAVVGALLTAPSNATELWRVAELTSPPEVAPAASDFDAWLADLLRELDAIDDVETREAYDGAAARLRDAALSRIDLSMISLARIERLTDYNYFYAALDRGDAHVDAVLARVRSAADRPDIDGAHAASIGARVAASAGRSDAPNLALAAIGHPAIHELLRDPRGERIFRHARLALEVEAGDDGPPPALAAIMGLLGGLGPELDASILDAQLPEAMARHDRADVREASETVRLKFIDRLRAAIAADSTDSASWWQRELAFLEQQPNRLRLPGAAAPEVGFLFWSDESNPIANLADLRGSVVVIDFWASDCGFCHIAHQRRKAFAREHESRPVRVVALASRSSTFVLRLDPMERLATPTLEAEADATRRYAALHEITWPMAIADWSTFEPTFGVREYPTTAVIDHRGVVRALGHDPRLPDETTALVAELLEERRTDLGEETARAAPPAAAPRDPNAPWSLPAGWRVSSERPPMRFATFVIDHADGPIEVAVTRFPGDVGGELANVNRWRGGVGLPPVTEEQLPSHLNRFENPGFAGYALRLRGERGSMIVAGIKEHAADRTWFVRVMGSEPVLDRVAPEVDEFIRSFGRVK